MPAPWGAFGYELLGGERWGLVGVRSGGVKWGVKDGDGVFEPQKASGFDEKDRFGHFRMGISFWVRTSKGGPNGRVWKSEDVISYNSAISNCIHWPTALILLAGVGASRQQEDAGGGWVTHFSQFRSQRKAPRWAVLLSCPK